MYGIDKVIEEIKSRCSDFDVDKAMKHAKSIKDKKPSMPEGEGMMVVEVSSEPVEKIGVPEEPKLPSEVSEGEITICPECGKDPCECEVTEEGTNSEEVEAPEESTDEEEKAQAEGMKAISETKETMEDVTPAEQDKIDEILKAIKTFFPNEKTEDVLVRIVSKLIDR